MSSGVTAVITPYSSQVQPGGDGFGQVLRSEWTKFRTVRGWVIGMVVAALVTLLLGVLVAVGGSITCGSSPDGSDTKSGAACRQNPPLGPDGEAVSDNFYFVHQTLTGNSSITARVASLTGLYSTNGALEVGGTVGMTPGTQPWSKAGIIIKQNTSQGSAYAAMMATGSNGVRMQYNYTHDIAGVSGTVSSASPRWLRLTRSGDTITGYDSTDGTHWSLVSTATLSGLPTTVQAGLFAASPEYVVTNQSFGGGSAAGGPTLATGTFDNVTMQSAASGSPGAGNWTGEAVSADTPRKLALGQVEGVQQNGGTFTVTGTGDIAPVAGNDSGRPPEQSLVGAFAGLIAIIVVAVMFITAEYRRGLIRVTLAASPRRGQVLAAKVIVIGVATFVVGLIAAAILLPLGDHLAYNHGIYVLPISTLTQLRLIVGTAALFALVAAFALGLGTLFKRSATAVTAGIVAVLLPYILSVASVLPASAAEWLTRLTPAAAFAIQQSLVPYSQVTGSYTPANGYFPLSAWEGLAVLCGYAVLVLWLASVRLRRRDA